MGHVIFNLLSGVGQSVLSQKEGMGHKFSSHHFSNCSGPPPLVLIDQSLKACSRASYVVYRCHAKIWDNIGKCKKIIIIIIINKNKILLLLKWAFITTAFIWIPSGPNYAIIIYNHYNCFFCLKNVSCTWITVFFTHKGSATLRFWQIFSKLFKIPCETSSLLHALHAKRINHYSNSIWIGNICPGALIGLSLWYCSILL